MTKEEYLEKAIVWIKKKSVFSLKAVALGYDAPKVFTNNFTKEKIQADLSFKTHGGNKHYTDVVLRKSNVKKTVARWKVLSFMASMKRGNLYLLTHKDHKKFTQNLVDTHNINALIHSF